MPAELNGARPGGAGLAEDAYFQPARLIKDGKVIRGEDGWLFLAADSNDVLGQHTGTVRLSETQLEAWRHLLEGRKHALEALGAHHLLLVPPNTHAIYEDKLPASIQPAPTRPIHQLMDRLGETGAEIQLVYPLDAMKAARRRRAVCCKTDSHWNEFGAFVAYQSAIDSLPPSIPVRRLYEDEIMFFEHEAVETDLRYKLERGEHASWTVGWLRHAGARLVSDNCVEGRGGLVVTECPYADGTCVLIGDSYSWALLKFLAESFRRLVFVQSSTFDYEFIARERPDVVINVVAERFLVFPPEDVGAPTIEEEARQKREIGRQRTSIPFWTLNRQPSLYEAEDLMSRLRADGLLQDAAIVSVLAYSALLPHEVLELRWSDIRDDTISVRRAFSRPSRLRRFVRRARRRLGLAPKPKRVIPLLPPLRRVLEEWHVASVGSAIEPDRVFPAGDGGTWKDGEWRAWREALAAVYGLGDWRPYSLRHTFCVLLINAGTPPDKLARYVGTTVDRIRYDYGLILAHAEQGAPVPVEAQVRWADRVTLERELVASAPPAFAQRGT